LNDEVRAPCCNIGRPSIHYHCEIIIHWQLSK